MKHILLTVSWQLTALTADLPAELMTLNDARYDPNLDKPLIGFRLLADCSASPCKHITKHLKCVYGEEGVSSYRMFTLFT